MISMVRRHVAGVILLVLAAFFVISTFAQDTLHDLNGAHFNIKYQAGIAPEEARKVMDFLQQEYRSLSAQLGLDLKSNLDVRIYESVGKYLSETGLKRPWRAAYFQRNILHLQPVSALMARNMFETGIKYELALAFLNQAGLKGCPRWLIESFAANYSGETKDMTPPLGVRLSSFSDLNQDIQEYPNPPQRDDVHFILAATMAYFVQRYGERQALGVFKVFDGVTPVGKVFKKAFNEEYSDIERAWGKHIAQRASLHK